MIEPEYRFKSGDAAKFDPRFGDEVYSIELPKFGSICTIVRPTFDPGMLMAWGVFSPMYEVSFQGQEKNIFIYEEDLHHVKDNLLA